jgi:uracil DNA glycosylase
MPTIPSAGDLLALTELFQGGGEPWLPLLRQIIEALPDAPAFIGPHRDQSVVPVRELTFQALKPNPPEKWKVVIFGQNPYPRIESATGIAMFDNTFHQWKDSQFGRVTSIRCIIKAACMWKHAIAKQTSTAEIRNLLAQQGVVQPPEWFQAMLTQGVLLLNVALTASSDSSRSTSQHTAFWRPVVEAIVEEILKAKQQADARHQGVVFAWWGSHARALRTVIERLQRKYSDVPVQHVDHCNPAAMGDAFCEGKHFAAVNASLRALNMDEVDWLPSVGWDRSQPQHKESAGRMGDFIAQTMELHKFYLDRLQGVKDEGKEELPAIAGVLATPLMNFADAVRPVIQLLPGLDPHVRRSSEFAQKKTGSATGDLSEHEMAALFLYTTESRFYRAMNASLRDANRSRIKPYFGYLRLFLSALSKLQGHSKSLWRGVALDLRAQYPRGGSVIWWGVSSCTAKMSVALGFLGAKGRRMLFEIKPLLAISIGRYSAFTGEDEYILPPGTQLKVMDVQNEPGGLCTVQLTEAEGQRWVS